MAMTPFLLFSLLLVAFLLPTLGALVARLAGRQSERAMLFIGGLTAVLAMASVVALQFVRADQVALGRYAIFVPARAPLIDNQTFALVRPTPVGSVPTVPAPSVVALGPTVTPTVAPTLTTLPTPTVLPTAPASTPTVAPTDTPVATDTPVPTATRAPTATPAPVATATRQAVQRRYTVQKGDSLRSIGEAFGVSVQALLSANDLTTKEGDNLQINQKLIIPAP